MPTSASRTCFRRGAGLVATVGLSIVTGCGYALGPRLPPGVATIAVPIFNNDTFPLRREVEYDLTSALRKEIQIRTPLRLVDSRQADLVVDGTVRDFRERVAAEGRADQKIESTIFIDVDIVVKDFRNGKQRQERVRVSEPLSIERGETLEVARSRAIGNLAERMVTVIEDWGDEG